MFPTRWKKLLALALPLLSGCEETFNPIQESDRYFSIFGVLDVAADTQWIRVMPVRNSIFTQPGLIDGVVELENLVTGEVVTLENRPAQYPARDPGIADDLYAHNFWTAQKIEHDTPYRLSVVRSDGAASYALTTTPRRLESVQVAIVQPPSADRDFVRLVDAPDVAMVHVIHHGRITAADTITGMHLEYQGMGESRSAGAWELRYLKRHLGSAFHPLHICWARQFRCEIAMVTSGSPWPHDPMRTAGALRGINAGSNVVGGVGYLGGISTERIPYEDCRKKVLSPSGSGLPAYCVLTYSDSSAAIEGKMWDACDGKFLIRPTIALTEIDGEHLRHFEAIHTGGAYRIGALVPGIRYAYRVAPAGYQEVEGTFTPNAGDTLRLDFTLQPSAGGC